MSEKHRGERLLPFTDAVVAIAMTLLILPLVDIANDAYSELLAEHRPGRTLLDMADLGRLLEHSIAPLIGFTISFFVIARLWWAHHAIFEGVRDFTTGMVAANVFWLFTIVLLPWVTVFSTDVQPNWAVSLIYVGTMTASSAMQTVLARMVLRAESEPDVPSEERYYGNLTTLVTFVIALVICIAFPWTYYVPLALLSFTGLVDRRVHRRLTAGSSTMRP